MRKLNTKQTMFRGSPVGRGGTAFGSSAPMETGNPASQLLGPQAPQGAITPDMTPQSG